MSRFLLGALAMGAVFALTSFALHFRPSPAVKPAIGPAWTVSQYQLDRAFRVQFAYVNPGVTVNFQVPSTGGFILTQFGSAGIQLVTINGQVQFSVSSSTSQDLNFNPPIIARPGDIVDITYVLNPVVCGFTTLPGET